MADKKTSEITELISTDAAADLLPVVDTSADETKKIRFSNLPLSDSAKNSVYTYTTDFHSPTAETRNITAPLTYSLYYGDDTTLTSIYIGSNVPSINLSAFVGCTALTNVTIGNGIASIGDNAFKDCTSLTSITIPDSVTSIGNEAFRECTDLTSITLPTNVNFTSIGNVAFYFCAGLTSITIPDSVTNIGTSAFQGCGLTSITIPDSVSTIKQRAFQGCNSAESLTLPNNAGFTTIEQFTFAECGDLPSLTIPNTVTNIGSYAFRNCILLSTINCNVNKTVIDNAIGVFNGTASPLTINVPAGLGWTDADGQTIGGNTNVNVNII